MTSARFLAPAFALFAILFCEAQMQAQVTITNGSFDSPTVSTFVTSAPTGWSLSGNGGVSNGTWGGSGFGVVGGSTGQFAYVQRFSGPSSISQSVTFPSAGNYQLTYVIAGRNAGSGGPGNCTYTTAISSSILSASGSTTSNQPFTAQSHTFAVATAGTYTLSFTNNTASGDNTFYVDTVAITAVNTAPTLTSVSTLTGATEDTAFSISYATLAAAANEADADGNAISFRVEAVSSGTLTKNGTAVTPGSTLLSTGETWVWTPATDAVGTLAAFTIKAHDGTTASASAVQVNVSVAATPVGSITATYTSASQVSAASPAPTITGGSTATLALGYAPTTGTELTVLRNTGLGFISGTFSNLAQGQAVSLSYGGVSYEFVANYYGGTGNDLVLVWKNNRPLAWGSNGYGQLGNSGTAQSTVPTAVLSSGELSGRTVLSVSAGEGHSVALCSDGTVLAWGRNAEGQLGTGNNTASLVPVLVSASAGSALSGKTVVAVSAGQRHSVALCSDGTVAAWGNNGQGQLGNSSTTNTNLPVAVTTSAGSALSGKTAVAIAVGYYHTMALCSDGTVAGWGYNGDGNLGNGTSSGTSVPVAVTTSGGSALSGKTVVAIAAGVYHGLALCSDGTVAAWGNNGNGQLGNSSTTSSNRPVAVTASAGSALSGKTVVALGAGLFHSVALCSDGTAAAWGSNGYGRLGNNSTSQSLVPVAVSASADSALSGKTVVSIAGGYEYSLALCSDGTVATWGSNSSGQLGNNSTTQSLVPVAVNTGALASGERFTRATSSQTAAHSLALAAVPPPTAPTVTTGSANPVASTTATLNGTVNAGGASTTVTFEYGLTTSYGLTATASQSPVSGTSNTAVSAAITGLAPHTQYHFRAVGVNSVGTTNGTDGTFTTLNTTPTLTTVSALSGATEDTAFSISYAALAAAANGADVDGDALSFRVEAVSSGTLTKGGTAVTAGTTLLSTGETWVWTPAANANGTLAAFTIKAYDGIAASASAVQVNVSVAAENDVPTLTSVSTLSGATEDTAFSISYATLAAAANEADVEGDALSFRVEAVSSGTLTKGGTAVTAGTTLLSTGETWVWTPAANASGTLGAFTIKAYDGIAASASAVQVNVNVTSVNDAPTLAAISDPAAVQFSAALQTVNFAGVAAGGAETQTLVVTASSSNTALIPHPTVTYSSPSATGSLSYTPVPGIGGTALITVTVTDDGGTANGGVNTVTRTFTVTVNGPPELVVEQPAGTALVETPTVLAWGFPFYGVTTVPAGAQSDVIAIAAGGERTLALKSNGSVVAWGRDYVGETAVPVEAQSGVTAIAAASVGYSHNLALKSDGRVIAWGYNGSGQATVPVEAQSGVTAIAAGSFHSVALKSNGKVVAWGSSGDGQTTVPVGAQTGVTAIAAGSAHTLALKSDGSVLAWGWNANGQATVPVAAQSGVIAIAAGHFHSLALKNDGSVIAWGTNEYGQTAVPAGAQSGVTAISAGYGHNLALKSNGSVVAWGWNQYGATTVPTGAQSGVTAISGGGQHTVAIVRKATVAFDAQAMGSSSTMKSFVVKNSGASALALTSVVVTGGNANNFTVNTSGMLSSVPAGGQTSFSVTFNPSSVGALTTTLRIASDDGDENPYDITLTGTGISAPTVATGSASGVTTTSATLNGTVNAGNASTTVTFEYGTTTSYGLTATASPSPVSGTSTPGVSAVLSGLAPHTQYHFRVVGVNSVGTTNGSAQTFTTLNSTPTLTTVTSLADASEDTAFSISYAMLAAAANEADADGDALSFRVEAVSSGTLTKNGTAVTAGTTLLSTGETWVWTPAADANGTLGAFTIKAYDGITASASAVQVNVSVAAVNDAPTLAAISDPAAIQLSAGVQTVNFSGVAAGGAETQTLSVTASSSNTALIPHPTVSYSSPSASGSLSYTPVAGSSGSAVITVTVTDDGGTANGGVNTASRTFTVTVNGSPELVVEQPAGAVLGGAGGVVAWGDNTFGATSVPAGAQSGVTAIDGGAFHTVALKSDGRVMAWGWNAYGQATVPVEAQSGVTAISACFYSSLALKGDGRVVAWGWNNSGQTTVPVAAQSGVTAIAAGALHSLALKSDGSVIGWGGGGFGAEVVPAAAQSGVIAIAAGNIHSLALKSDGSVIAWGYNSAGQTTVPVAAQSGVIAIATKKDHNVALKSDGSVIAWGRNDNGETIVPAGAQSGVIAIAAGGYHSAALKSDGTVIAWGANHDGRTTVPTDAQSGVIAIAAGDGHSLAIVRGTPIVAFGEQATGSSSAAKSFVLKNTGMSPLALSSVAVTGGDAGDFSVDSSGMLSSVPAGGQTTVSVTFNPSAVGTRSTTLRIASDDADENPYDISLTGTGISAPTVTTGTANPVASTTATLNGTVNAGNASTTVTFEYGTTSSYGLTATASQSPVSGTSNTSVSAAITGLAPHTQYHFRAVGVNSAGTTNGSAQTFTTANTNPTAPGAATTGTTGDQQTYTVSFPATDADGDAVSITNAASGTGVTVNSFTGTSVTFTPLSNFTGSGSFSYTVSDGFGGTATGTITVAVTDNDAPSAPSFTGGPANGVYVSATFATFSFGNSTDNVGPVTYEGSFDGAAYTTVTSSTTFSGLAPGSHIFNVRARDAAGNLSVTVARTWFVQYPLKLVADSKSREYGAPNPVFTGSVLGLQGSDTATAYWMTSAGAASGVGSYPITWSMVGYTGPPRYYIQAAQSGTLTITPATTTTTMGNKSLVFSPAAQGVFLSATVASHVAVNASTVTFRVKDGATTLGSAVTSTALASGSASVNYTLPAGLAEGTYTIEATYNGGGNFNGSIGTGTLTVIAPPSLASLAVSGFPNPATAGTAGSFTVTAKDSTGATLPGYTGTVAFSSSDANGVLPASYTFLPADNGVKTFSATLRRAGTRSITATDAANAVSGSQSGIVVNPRVGSGGQLFAWGSNSSGQLGDGTTAQRSSRVPVTGITAATAVAAGAYHSLAVMPDGTVRAWGQNSTGQLGTGNTLSSPVPVLVPGLSNVSAVAAGQSFSLALKSDGTVWGWGSNFTGQLGDGSTAQRNAPRQVIGLTGVTAIAAGQWHSLALKSDGTVWAWGGHLGDNSGRTSFTPVQVRGVGGWGSLSGIVGIAAGTIHSAALKSDGTVFTWGTNTYGQLGDGTTTQRLAPVQVKGVGGSGTLSGITALASGGYHLLALKSDGTVLAWGFNGSGGCGDGTTVYRYVPVQVSGLSGVTALAGGHVHSLARKSDGTLWAWGSGYYGVIGNGSTSTNLVPAKVSGFTSATLVSAGPVDSGNHNLAVEDAKAATQFLVTAPAGVDAGSAFDVSVRAVDASGNSVAHVGTVKFSSNDALAGLPANYSFVASDGGVKTFSVTLNTAGAKTVTIAHATTPSITGTATVQVQATGSSTITETIATEFNAADQYVPVTARVTSVGTVSQGLVTFQLKDSGGANVGTPVLAAVTNGVATASYLVPGGTPAAIYPIHASYGGGESFTASSGSGGFLRLGQAPTNMQTVAAAATTAYSLAPQSVTLSAGVSSSAGTVNEGTIAFRVLDTAGNVVESAMTSAPLTAGSGSVSYLLPAALPAGDYSIETAYSGGVNFESSLGTATLSVTPAASVTIADSAQGNYSSSEQTVALRAMVTSAAGILNEGTVTFQLKTSGGANVGVAVTSPVLNDGEALAIYTLPGGTVEGLYSLQATYSGSGNVSASSDSAQTLTLIFIPLLTTVDVPAKAVDESSAAQAITLEASITASASSDPVNEGSVTFTVKRNGDSVGTAVTSGTVSGGAASASYTLPAGSLPGIYLIEASYSGSDHYLESSTVGSLTVNDVTKPVITFVSPNVSVDATSTDGATVTYAAATATDNSGDTPVITYSHASGSLFSIGTRTVTVTATDASGNFSTETFTVTVVGHPEIVVEQPETVDLTTGTASIGFGSELVLSPSVAGTPKVFTLRNHGTRTLTLYSISTEEGNAADFTVDTSSMNGTAPAGTLAVISAGQSATFSVAFAPTAPGTRSSTLRIVSDDEDEDTFDVALTGTGLTPTPVVFSNATYTVNQGATSVTLTLTRADSATSGTLTIDTDNGSSSAAPPFTPAVAVTDYVDLTGAATTVDFAVGELSKTVTVTLIPKTGTVTNRRFTATISSPTPGLLLGSTSTATVRILADDSTLPSLQVINPAPSLSTYKGLPAYTVNGTATDSRGIDRVEVAINGGSPVIATLGTPNALTIPYSAAVTLVPGPNSIQVTSFDLRGNTISLTRSFSFDPRYQVTISRTVPSAMASTPDSVGLVTLAGTPATGASGLLPSAANSNPKMSTAVSGTVIKLTATSKVGYVFSHWTGVPAGGSTAGTVATFTLGDADVSVNAVFVASPFTPPNGGDVDFYGLIRPEAPATGSVQTEAFLVTSISTTGALTGKLSVAGVAQSFTGTVLGDGTVLFKVGTQQAPNLVFGTRTLALSYNAGSGNNKVAATLTNSADGSTSRGIARRSIYSASNPVPAALRNSATSGMYTMGILPKTQTPEKPSSEYPQGDGYATLTVSNVGVVMVSGLLADGTTLTGTSEIVEGNECPIYVQVVSPGAAATVKQALLLGTLVFDSTGLDSDVSGTDLLWFRPAVNEIAGTTVSALATQRYTVGWPGGITVDAVGALYDKTQTAQATMGLGSTDLANGNAVLTFEAGKLTEVITKTKFNINGSTVTKIPAADASYTLTVAPTTGLVSGTFTPNWTNPAAAKPAFKGIMIQKGANRGGFGHFTSNAVGDLNQEVGGVTLGKP